MPNSLVQELWWRLLYKFRFLSDTLCAFVCTMERYIPFQNFIQTSSWLNLSADTFKDGFITQKIMDKDIPRVFSIDMNVQ